MKKIYLICSLSLALLPSAMHGQDKGEASINAILQQIEVNNKQLQSNERQTAAQKLENRTANNLPDPTLSYAHLWDSDDKDITVGELVIAQSFDFPSLYVTRAKLNRLKSGSLDAQANALRQDILLQAQEACLDIIWLSRQQQILEERLRNAEELAEMYRQRLETGDANSLETNKINLELLNVRTEARMNRTALQNKLKELTALNLGLTDYPAMPLPDDFGPLCEELLAGDPALQSLEHESQVARKQLSVSRQGWLPQLELGYRRNTETRHPLNGLVVGFSFPIFQNHGKVKTARTQAQSIDFQKENAKLNASTALWQLYDEACNLHASIEEYNETFRQQQDLKLLRRALEGGEISMIEYFVEVSVVYQSQSNLLQLENQYQKAMARIYKSRL